MTINKTGGSGVYTADDRIVVTGALQLTDGIIGGGTVEAQAGVTLASAFDGGGGSLMFSGAANQIYTNNGGLNPTGTWTINKTAGSVTMASDLILGVSTPLNITSGTLDQGPTFSLRPERLRSVWVGSFRTWGPAISPSAGISRTAVPSD